MSIILNGQVIAGAPAPGITPYTSNPAMDGTPTPGASANYARGDHAHPHDSNKADRSELTDIFQTGSTCTEANGIAAGVYFYLDGNLVVAKTAIQYGNTFTNGTNYETPTAGALNALKSAFAGDVVELGRGSAVGDVQLSDNLSNYRFFFIKAHDTYIVSHIHSVNVFQVAKTNPAENNYPMISAFGGGYIGSSVDTHYEFEIDLCKKNDTTLRFAAIRTSSVLSFVAEYIIYGVK